ncbi:MAG: hypothetical protein NTZ64_15495 [Polaromonas sp.]|nr:hypothetical protein [Polaromonas sp.]
MNSSAQAKLANAGSAAGAGSGADVTDPTDAHQIQALLVDIFAQTGQKVERTRQDSEHSACEQQLASNLHQAGQLSPGRTMTLVLLCLLAGALGAGIALTAHRWLG